MAHDSPASAAAGGGPSPSATTPAAAGAVPTPAAASHSTPAAASESTSKPTPVGVPAEKPLTKRQLAALKAAAASSSAPHSVDQPRAAAPASPADDQESLSAADIADLNPSSVAPVLDARAQLKLDRKRQRRLDILLNRALGRGLGVVRGSTARCEPKGTSVVITTVLEAATAASIPAHQVLGRGAVDQRTMRLAHRDTWLVQQEVRLADLIYADWFWRHNHEWGFGVDLFPNVKEMTESAAAHHQLQRHAALGYDDQVGALCLVVGDGDTPRTGALLACLRPQHRVWSIDPRMRPATRLTASTEAVNDLDHLHTFAGTVEQFVASRVGCEAMVEAAAAARPILLVGIHSHARLCDYLPQVRALVASASPAPDRRSSIWIMGVPCCVPQTLHDIPGATDEFELIVDTPDWSIQSPQRHVLLWRTKPRTGGDTTS